MREDEEDDMTLQSPLPPMTRQPSEKLQWRSIAYYNCTACNRVGADYIINVPEEEHHLPIPVCSSCYHRAVSNERMKKK
jgi:hypothetical protein